MLIDGRAIALDLQKSIVERVTKSSRHPTLIALQVGDNPASESFLRIKEKFGVGAGIRVVVERFPERIETDALEIHTRFFAARREVAAMIVQLPLPAHIDKETILKVLPIAKDPDLLSPKARALFAKGKSPVLPPVVAAVREIFRRSNIDMSGRNVLVIGQGELVGKPVTSWLREQGIEPTIATRDTANLSALTKEADIIISGAGTPSLIKPAMLKRGVVLIDAGTSEEGGRLVGDADPECESVAPLVTPVPGGVGPIAVAKLFENICTLNGF